MYKNRLLEKIREKKTAVGVGCLNPDMVELCGHLGFDWFQLDMMFAANDWRDAKRMIITGEASDITPVVRIPSNPWAGYDHRIAVDVQRAQGIGSDFIKISFCSKKEIEEAVFVARDWHKKNTLIHPFDNLEWDKKVDQIVEDRFIIPSAETQGAFDAMEDVISMPEIKIFFISATDASKVFSGQKKPNFNHPELWKYLEKAVKIGEKNGTIIAANTSYAYTMKELRERVKRLHETGIKIIMIQNAHFLFKVGIKELLTGVSEDLKLT